MEFAQIHFDGAKATPRLQRCFHSQRNIAQPGKPTEPFPIAEAEGTGFLAGYIIGWRQRDHTDMVFHNGGTSHDLAARCCWVRLEGVY